MENTNSFDQIPVLNAIPSKWRGYALLIFMAAPYLTRAWHAWRSGGGLRGIWSSIMFGTNTPKVDATASTAATTQTQISDTMKNILILLSLSLTLTLAAGCKTMTRPGSTNTVTVPDVELMKSTAQSAAFIGTTIYLNGLGTDNIPAHPEARAAFETARLSLRTLIAAGSFSPSDLTAVLKSLPVQELKGDAGTLVIGEAVILWDQYGRQLADLDKAQVFNTYVLPVAKAILNGLDLAMGPPAPQ